MQLGVAEGERTGARPDAVRTQNFCRLMSDTQPQIQGIWRTPRRINVKEATPKQIISKLQKTKDKEKILGEARGKVKTPYL